LQESSREKIQKIVAGNKKKKSKEDAPAGDDSETIVQLKYKYETSAKKSEEVQILAILPQKLNVSDKNSLEHQII
jgi:hypothetical protein